MRVIFSHDVDHLHPAEHLLHDLIAPKFLVKTGLEKAKGEIGWVELGARLRRLLENRWHNLGEVMDLDESMGIPSVFFVGMRRGLGLSYSLEAAGDTIDLIRSRNFEVGVHGIAYEERAQMEEEYRLFSAIPSAPEPLAPVPHVPGVRMHYLRSSTSSLSLLDEIGYAYDSSTRGVVPPYRARDEYNKGGGIWEFPVTLMDVDIYRHGGKIRSFEEMKNLTLEIFEEASRRAVGYITVIFHDRYFSPEFADLRSWYLWLVELVSKEPYRCIGFSEAVGELESKPSSRG